MEFEAPKYETGTNVQNPNILDRRKSEFWSFEFVSDFEFRISFHALRSRKRVGEGGSHEKAIGRNSHGE